MGQVLPQQISSSRAETQKERNAVRNAGAGISFLKSKNQSTGLRTRGRVKV